MNDRHEQTDVVDENDLTEEQVAHMLDEAQLVDLLPRPAVTGSGWWVVRGSENVPVVGHDHRLNVGGEARFVGPARGHVERSVSTSPEERVAAG